MKKHYKYYWAQLDKNMTMLYGSIVDYDSLKECISSAPKNEYVKFYKQEYFPKVEIVVDRELKKSFGVVQ